MSTFIFDFDGTLANNVDALLEIANGLADEFGFEAMDQEEFQRLRGMNSREILQEGRISIWKLPRLVRRIKREQRAVIDQIAMMPGMREVLLAMKQRGDRLGIATSNSSENIQQFLHNNDLDNFFEFQMTGITLFGKARALRKIIRQYHLQPAETIYVGDEVRDITAAQEVGVHSLGVSWGFNTIAALEAAEAEFVVEVPQDMLRLSLSSEVRKVASKDASNRSRRQPIDPQFPLQTVPFPSFEAKSILESF